MPDLKTLIYKTSMKKHPSKQVTDLFRTQMYYVILITKTNILYVITYKPFQYLKKRLNFEKISNNQCCNIQIFTLVCVYGSGVRAKTMAKVG